jgi:hypothetical protein
MRNAVAHSTPTWLLLWRCERVAASSDRVALDYAWTEMETTMVQSADQHGGTRSKEGIMPRTQGHTA